MCHHRSADRQNVSRGTLYNMAKKDKVKDKEQIYNDLVPRGVQDDLARIKKEIEEAYKYFESNYKTLADDKRFLFLSTIKDTQETDLPPISCNLIQAYISRQRGEFGKCEPSIYVSSDYDNMVSARVLEILEGRYRHIERDASSHGVTDQVFTDGLCGMGVFKVVADYQDNFTFKQDLKLTYPQSSIMCGFDPDARDLTKCDGRFVFEVFCYSEDTFENKFPDVDIDKLSYVNDDIGGFHWSGQTATQKKYILCADFYERKQKRVKLVKIARTPAVKSIGHDTMTYDQYKRLCEAMDKNGVTEAYPKIIDERWTQSHTIVMYRIIRNQVIDYKETVFSELPLTFFMGGSQWVSKQNNESPVEVTRSYFRDAIGTQQLADNAMRMLGSEIETIPSLRMSIPEQGMPDSEAARMALMDLQIPTVVMYKQYMDKSGVKPGDIPLNPPQYIPRSQIPPEFMQTITMCFQLMQNVLGTFDSQLGINSNQLSGISVIESATQNNAVAMPFFTRYMQALAQVGKVILTAYPKLYSDSDDDEQREMQIKTKDGKTRKELLSKQDLQYSPHMIKVAVKIDQNAQIMKTKLFQYLQTACQSVPGFADFIKSSPMMLEMIKLMDVPNIEPILDDAKQFIQQQKKAQAQMPPNPIMLKAQTDQAKVQVEAQQNQAENQLRTAELAIAKQDSDNERMRIMLDAKNAHESNLVQHEKSQTERAGQQVDLAIKSIDQQHRHNMDHNKHALDVYNSVKQPEVTPSV